LAVSTSGRFVNVVSSSCEKTFVISWIICLLHVSEIVVDS
jgi:hypothetical protein